MVISHRYPLVNVNKKLWKITISNGKIHYFYGHFQFRKLFVYQRVNEIIHQMGHQLTKAL
jgi:hypothetical protein